jgi:hypothetical protein
MAASILVMTAADPVQDASEDYGRGRSLPVRSLTASSK